MSVGAQHQRHSVRYITISTCGIICLWMECYRTVRSTTMTERQTNWAGNHTYSAARLHYPETIEEVQELVAGCKKLRVLGSRHSFNSIADSTEDLISLERLNSVLAFDSERRTVTVEAGIKYGQLGQQLHSVGYALHNMASLPHISVAG